MFQRFESLVFVCAACVLIAVTGYVFFASKISDELPVGANPPPQVSTTLPQ